MLTTVTNNSPQAINTSLFSLDREVQEVKKTTDAINNKLSGIDAKSGVIAVNGKQGIVELDASDVDALPSSTVIPTRTSQLTNDNRFITINDVGASFVPVTRKVNNKQLNTDITLTASDVGALPNTTVIPTETSQLTNDSGFITSSDSITGNAATATRAEQDADGNVITDTYATKAELGNKVDKVNGKGLSTNDFTTAEKEKLAGLSNYNDSAVKTLIANETSERKTADGNLQTQITANKSAIDTLNGTGEGSVQKTVTDEIAKVVANAPEDFDTLKEISDWIDTHEDSASAMNTQITTNKNDIASLKTAVAGKSDIGHKHSASDITSGTLPIARGGTGQTTQADINKAIIGGLPEGGSVVTDGTMFVSSWASDNGFADTNAVNVPYKRKFSLVWEYIKNKISSVLGLTATNYGGKASTAKTADKTVNDITMTIPFVGDNGRYVIPLGNILEPTSTEISSPYNWDIAGFFSIIRPTGHNGSHIEFEAGHGYSHGWTTYAYLDSDDFNGVTTSIKAFQYNGKWWLGLYILTSNQGYEGKMTITYRRGLPATPTCILYESISDGIANEEIYNSIQDIPSSWWRPRNIYNPTTFTKNITAPNITSLEQRATSLETELGELDEKISSISSSSLPWHYNFLDDGYSSSLQYRKICEGYFNYPTGYDNRWDFHSEIEIINRLPRTLRTEHGTLYIDIYGGGSTVDNAYVRYHSENGSVIYSSNVAKISYKVDTTNKRVYLEVLGRCVSNWYTILYRSPITRGGNMLVDDFSNFWTFVPDGSYTQSSTTMQADVTEGYTKIKLDVVSTDKKGRDIVTTYATKDELTKAVPTYSADDAGKSLAVNSDGTGTEWVKPQRIKIADYKTGSFTFNSLTDQKRIELSNFGPDVTENNVLNFMVIYWTGVPITAEGDWATSQGTGSSGLSCALKSLNTGTGWCVIRCVYLA